MFPSWRLGRPFGINVFIHWTFWLLPLWILFRAHPESDGVPRAIQLGLTFALFGCVILHELGHALAARYFGIGTARIVLTPIGGVAQLEQPIRSPWQEFCIALAGPLVNFVIALGLGALLLAGSTLAPVLGDGLAGTLLFLLLMLNLVMGVFNLLPAFPMDGGRILRALLTAPLGHLGATRAAVAIGNVVIVVGALIWALYFGNPWALVIAGFVLWTGNAELASLEAEQRHRDAAEELPLVMPLRSTVRWPAPAGRVTVYIWDAHLGRWVREDAGGA